MTVVVIYHMIICLCGMAKKVAISITIDGDILRQLDAYVRQVQERELRSRRSLSTRSSVIERIIREGLGGERAS